MLSRYSRFATTPWLAPLPLSPLVVVAICLALLGAITATVSVRHSQFETWHKNIEINGINGTASFSTTDGPFFLRTASVIASNGAIAELPEIRNQPARVMQPVESQGEISIKNRPLISVILAYFAKSTNATDLLDVAHVLTFITAALTASMIIFSFGVAGYWFEGSVASVGGTLSAAYLPRSSIGRIDTDQMNLGFLYLLFGLAYLVGSAKTRVMAIIWALIAGGVANVFFWWYGKSEFMWIIACSMAWFLIFIRRDFLLGALAPFLFFQLSGSGFHNIFEAHYFEETQRLKEFSFLNTYETITELSKLSISGVLQLTSGSVQMGLFGIAGLILFTVRHPIIAFGFGPLFCFLFLNSIYGNRIVFYSAPILWFGTAFLMISMARCITASLSKAGYVTQRDQITVVSVAGLTMLVAWVNSPTHYVPRPSFPKPVLEGFASLKTTADPDNSIVATWWDYGYASMFFNDLPTFHDGGAQTSPSTYFIARAFLDADQRASIGNLKFLTTKGHKGISAQTTVAGLKAQFSEAADAASPDLYIVVTNQMASWMGSISKIGNWDIEASKPVTPRGNRNGPILDYERLNCRLAGYPQSLKCGSASFDLEQGLMKGEPALAGWAHAKDGTLVRRQSFNHDGHLVLQIVQTGNRVSAFMMHRQLFESTFNELYHLGQIDHPAISLHYDDYPHIRIYKLEGAPAG